MGFKNRNVVLVTGASTAGKDTVCTIMNMFVYSNYTKSEIVDLIDEGSQSKYYQVRNNYGAHGRFAEVPYKMLSGMLNIHIESLMSHSVKDSPINDSVFGDQTPRDILKWLAESAKKEFGDDIWAKLLLRDLGGKVSKFPLVTVADLRFASELEVFKHLDPIVVYVEREYEVVRNEADVRSLPYNARINNYGDVKTLVDNVEHFLTVYGFLPSDWASEREN